MSRTVENTALAAAANLLVAVHYLYNSLGLQIEDYRARFDRPQARLPCQVVHYAEDRLLVPGHAGQRLVNGIVVAGGVVLIDNGKVAAIGANLPVVNQLGPLPIVAQDPTLQQELEAQVEALMRARGFGYVVDGWGGEIERVKAWRFDSSR